MKILVINKAASPDDRGSWSGTVYQAIQGLKRAGFEVDYLCALEKPNNSVLSKLLFRYWNVVVTKFLGYNTRTDESYYGLTWYTKTLRHFDYTSYDVIFIPTHINIVNALPKNVKAKVVHLVDATPTSLVDYYTEFSNLIFHNRWTAYILGKRAFRRSDLIIASSDWCRQNAIHQYGCDPKRIVVVEFGANIDILDVPALPKKINGKESLNIYFSTVNWVRKGGDVVLACCEELIRRGLHITLHITGIKPEDSVTEKLNSLNYVKNYGFLNKNNEKEYRKIINIMTEADIFLFPSRAECSSIALCEANGFGLPCFVYDTGGTDNYVVNGVNGYMLPLSADGKQFADRVIQSINVQEMNRLSEGAVKRYKEHLNWKVWSEKVKKSICSLKII